MARHAYQIPLNIDPTTLPFVFDNERTIKADGTGYVEVEGTLAGYDEVPLRSTVGEGVPEYVDARQFFLQLEAEGLTTAVNDAIAASSSEVQISFNKSQKFFRTNPIVLQMAQALSKTDAELDEFFIQAKAR